MRRFLIELHLAATRYPDLALLLGEWHVEEATRCAPQGVAPAQAKAFFLVLLGCCHLESLCAIDAPLDFVEPHLIARRRRARCGAANRTFTNHTDFPRNHQEGDMTVEFSLDSEEFQADPARVFAALRAAQCPVQHNDTPAPHYTVSHYADVASVLRDTDVWKSRFGPGLSHQGGGVLVSVDPPKHTTDRLAITRIFKPSAIESMRGDVTVLVDELVGAFAAEGKGDLVGLLGMPLPLTVMCWLLGTPTEDIGLFRDWVLPMAEAVSYAQGRMAGRPASGVRSVLCLLHPPHRAPGRRHRAWGTMHPTTSSHDFSPSSETASGCPGRMCSGSASFSWWPARRRRPC